MSTNTETTATQKTAPVAAKKPAKKAAPKKAKASAKKAKAGGAKRVRLAEQYAGKKVKLLVKENPKRKGAAPAKRFDLYKNGMTVETFLEKGGTAADVRWDVKHKYIALN